MAKKQISRKGFGQVEPNHLSAQTNGQIYAQLPASTVFNILENGMFLKYDYPNKECNLTGKGEWMLVMNEIKLYDQRAQALKDYAMQKSDFMSGELVPRLLRTEIGDIYTTNMVKVAAGLEYAVGDKLVPVKNTTSNTLVLEKNNAATTGMIWVVVKVYTMPDGQPGLKLQRVH
jgi:hypothetical protein